MFSPIKPMRTVPPTVFHDHASRRSTSSRRGHRPRVGSSEEAPVSAEENKAMVRRMYEALAEGDPGPFRAAFADDVVYTIIGSTIASGTFHGMHELVEGVLKPLGRGLAGPLVLTPTTIVAEGDTVVVELTGAGKTRAGGRYDNVYCQVLQVRDGRITRLTEYLDTELVTEAFGPPS
jgi:ketosteroid isomerase-like protein